jgi:hypothetical protein
MNKLDILCDIHVHVKSKLKTSEGVFHWVIKMFKCISDIFRN